MKLVALLAAAGWLVAGAAMAADPTAHVKASTLPVFAGAAMDKDRPAKIATKEASTELRIQRESDMLAVSPSSAVCMTREGVGPYEERVVLPAHSGVVAIRLEQLVEDPAGAVLSAVNVFVDTRTSGSKTASTETVRLALVASLDDANVYGYRDAQSVHLVWSTRQEPARWRDAKSTVINSRCGIAHLALDAKDANGRGATAVGLNTVTRTIDGKPKTREFRVNASLSQLSRDPEPTLSVSLALGDPQRVAMLQLPSKSVFRE